MDVSKSASNFFSKAKKVERSFMDVINGKPQEINTGEAQQAQPAQAPQEAAPAPGAGAGRQRFQLMQMMQPEPTRDSRSEEMIKKRAKVNAIGRGIGALGQLAGVASGGDASFIPDAQSPFLMNEFNKLDTDYRSRLQDWTKQGFQVDQFNNRVQNDAIQDQARLEDGIELDNARTANDKILNEQRAEYAIQNLMAKSKEELESEMRKVGVNPSDPEAMGKLMKANGLGFSTEINRKKAQTNWNNRVASGSGRGNTGGAKDPEYDLATLKKGKDAMIAQIDAQIKQMNDSGDAVQNQEQMKALLDQRSQLQQYNPGKNQMIDAEIMQMGIQQDEGDFGGQGSAKQQNPMTFDPARGFNNTPKSKDDPNVRKSIETGLGRVLSGDLSDIDNLVKTLTESGVFKSEEEAEFWLAAKMDEQEKNN